jgi:protein-disulfide isomerase
MRTTTQIAIAVAAGAALAAARAFQAGASDAAATATPSPADLSALLPGVDVEDLSPAQREVLARVVQDEFCYCGCPHTLSGCVREHRSCKHGPRMAALAARMARSGLTQLEILKLLTEYYASFDRQKRARLDVKAFGPPLGDPEAPLTLVEFSDFACPYCQALRPRLEEFVKARSRRVKLFYKPYPLQGHEHAAEAAEAAEWARDKGLFWRMHDALFDDPHALAIDDLAVRASRLGGDPDDLRQAVEGHRHRARIQASQEEARAAGLTGTPTLFLEGRRLIVPDLTEAGLEFTLEDEEEWKKNGGWAKD